MRFLNRVTVLVLSILSIFSIILPQLLVAGWPGGGNIFQDPVLRDIYTLQNQRNGEGLLVYLGNKEPRYRKAAAIGLASVQSPGVVEPLSRILKDENPEVRLAVAYAMGQVGDNQSEPYLLKAYCEETCPDVKQAILEALGKCGTTKGLTFLIDLSITGQPEAVRVGQVWGIYRYLLRNIILPGGTQLCVESLAAENPVKVRLIAANYLARGGDLDLTAFRNALLEAVKKEKDVFVLMNVVRALGKVKHNEALARLKELATAGQAQDYRVRVNALRALADFEYKKVSPVILKLTADPDVSVAVTASEYFTLSGNAGDAQKYLATAQELNNWRTRANMLTAALTFEKNSQKRKRISDSIITAYNQSVNPYEKASLCGGLSGDLSSIRFIETCVNSNIGKEPVISTSGMNALVEMSKTAQKKGDRELFKTLSQVLKRGIESGDSSIIAVVAGVLRDPGMEFKQEFKDISFLEVALAKCQGPEHIEARLELEKTIAFFKGEEKELKPGGLPGINRPIDWEKVVVIPPDQRIRVKTSKGNIVIQLKVEQAPGSVLNFIELIKENFYLKAHHTFHRVVPNFVIQGGCPWGDGFGGPAHTIGSELGPLNYEEGTVGMASAGKDTEGSQWFITHSPVPHLDGRYSIFGTVVEGMDVVHKIEIGDQITGFDIL